MKRSDTLDKKGQQMTLTTVIVIILGIAVLVFLIFGFASGWSNLWDRIVNLGGGSTNLDTIKQGCALACTGQSAEAYCNEERTIKYGRKVKVEGSDILVKTNTGTCKDIAANPAKYNGTVVAPCPGLC